MICNSLHPGFLLILAGLLLPLLTANIRKIIVLLIPALSLAALFFLPADQVCHINYLGLELQPLRLDKLSHLFLIVFGFTFFATILFCFRQGKLIELAAAFIYAGSAMSVILAGDLLTLFLFWELMALSSATIVWSAATEQAQKAGMRYLLIHLFGGTLLLFGIVGYYLEYQTVQFDLINIEHSFSWLILAGFLINVGAPPLSAWVADAYPEASFSGMVFLSAFTTKTAVYVLARTFPGVELLIWIGLFMIFYGIVYALLENDMRRILAYSIINQVGFMVCGIGIGTAMALNGAAAHAFTHIIYKALLLMSAGSVLYITGKRKCTDLGGLAQVMPITMLCALVGALAISSFPLTSGFVSKSMTLQAAADTQLFYIWLLLQAASAGVFLHAGIKFPWFVFFQKDAGLRATDPPWNMQLAMFLLVIPCIFLGVYPDWLYSRLPFFVDYVPYTAGHVLAQLQLLLFSGLAFFVMLPWMQRTLTISLDLDWFYRRLPFSIGRAFARLPEVNLALVKRFSPLQPLQHGFCWLKARYLSTSYTVLLILGLLGFLLFCYLIF